MRAIGEDMKTFLLVLVAISAAVDSAAANLGDSEAKINASYGKRIETPMQLPGSQGHSYQKGPYTYSVMFKNGVSVFEMYSHTNQRELSPKEIASFLKANAGGATWVLAGDKPAGREWKRSDHKAKAAYSRSLGAPMLTVMEATPKR
jgi:hypothetical protein